MFRAYDEKLLNNALICMATALDYAINDCGFPAEIFEGFVNDKTDFEKGKNIIPDGREWFVNGMKDVLEITDWVEKSSNETDSKEYWAGWVIAYYQWRSGKHFCEIFSRLHVQDIIDMYDKYSEKDMSEIVKRLDYICHRIEGETNLKRLRSEKKLSQGKLAKLSGVGVRMIQLYEQRVNNINHATADKLYHLAWVLECNMEDLLEPEENKD